MDAATGTTLVEQAASGDEIAFARLIDEHHEPMWYVSHMSHMTSMSHLDYAVRLGDRGRLVLPAEVRRALDIQPGDELIARLDGDGVRIVSRRQLARQARGSLARMAPERDLVAELLAERRAETERE